MRKILRDGSLSLEDPFPFWEGSGEPPSLGDVLLIPTRIYRDSLAPILGHRGVTGLSHITGGGLYENIPRMLPPRLQAEIWEGTWPLLPVYRWLMAVTGKPLKELAVVFNGGLGMVLAVRPEALQEVREALWKTGEPSYVVGRVAEGSGGLVWREEGP